jgi:hypothetical protein
VIKNALGAPTIQPYCQKIMGERILITVVALDVLVKNHTRRAPGNPRRCAK